jgi:multidrug efflux pump subunit AcrB
MPHFDPKEIKDLKPGPIAWMASHPVAANLLMLIFIFGGLLLCLNSKKEVFPEFALDSITISMAYPGASPEEVEQGIVLAIEDAITDIEGLGEITSKANEGFAQIIAEIDNVDETIRIAQDAKTAVDRITTFPIDAEELKVSVSERRRNVMKLALYGDVSATILREAAEQFHDILEQNPDIGSVELTGAKEFEIHIEISQENLRRYNLTLASVASRIQQIALELGGGALDTSSGEILVRMSERRDFASEFKNIPIILQENGAQLLLGDIAVIKDGFDDSNSYSRFNGKPAIQLEVFRVGKQTPTGVSSAVQKHIDEISEKLPVEIQVSVLDDDSTVFKQRAELLVKNGFLGLILVVLFLALFLDLRLAFWVSMGIPISFMGAFLLFPATSFSINVISMFAFIISLGIVVDDAIVSGESIYSFRQKGHTPLKAAVLGARDISTPITISVLTNIVAFIPLFFVPGFMGKVFSIIPIVVISTFFVSLIESLFVLPSHLTFAHRKAKKGGVFSHFINAQKRFSDGFRHFVENHYGSFMKYIIKYRYIVFSFFLAILIVVGGYVSSGRMGLQLFPRVDSDFAVGAATLKVGAPLSELVAVEKQLINAAQKVIDNNGGDALSKGIFTGVQENQVNIYVFLTEPDIRPISTAEFVSEWRKETGDFAGLESLSLQSNSGGPGAGKSLTVELSHRDTQILDQAAIKLAQSIREFPLAKDIDDGSAQGKKQFDFKMKPLGYTLGLTTTDIARQVRAAFYGSEAFKQQRGRHEVRVLIRYPENERTSQFYLKNLIINAPDGTEVLLRDVVEMHEGRAYTTINRRDGRRTIQVSADIDPPSMTGKIISSITQDALPKLQAEHPGLSYSFEGQQADMRESLVSLFYGLIAILFVMYAILAVLFSSYTQPFMVLLAIPFSAIGAVFGHHIMGYSLSIVSMFGLIALAGVVVNGSLILIDLVNRKRKEGLPLERSIIEAGIQRFRPIILTTLTTFIGLAPMMFETSRQARFLIPMAISLGYGVVFATLLTLILIPALYKIIEDIKAIRFSRYFKKASSH